MTNYLTLIVLMGIIHRYRGTSYPLPVKNVWWCWIAIYLLLTAMNLTTAIALTWALGWALWSIPGWMRVISRFLNINDAAYGQGRTLTWDERFIDWMSFGNAYAAIYLRAFVWIIPLSLALIFEHQNPWPLLIIVAVFPWAYWVGLKTAKDGDIAKVAELLVGCSWGLAMALSIWPIG